MKTLVKVTSILFLSIFSLSACSESSDSTPKEGKQYSLLPEVLPADSVAPVMEVFSLTCGHCREMEKFIPTIAESVGTDIGKLHITFNQSALSSAMFYYAAEMQLDAVPDHQFMDELFGLILMDAGATEQQKMDVLDGMFTSRGLVNPFQFNQSQLEKVTQRIHQAQDLSELSGINSVPTFVVKGRYQIIVAGHSDAEDIAATISYLLEK